MKKQNTQRWLAMFMVFVMLIGVLPMTAFAEGHTHTESCYAKEGDLLCSLEEATGHTHTQDCYCLGGENICGLEATTGHTHSESCYSDEINTETATVNNLELNTPTCGLEVSEGHTHTDDCICPGGELICNIAESEGHSHTEDCYAQGGELICAFEDTSIYNDLGETSNEIIDSDYDSLADAVQNISDSEEKAGTIQITKDHLMTAAITIPTGVSIKLTDAGSAHTITKSKDTDANMSLFVISEGASLTVDGELTFTTQKTGYGLIECRGEFVLENGIFDGDGYGIQRTSDSGDTLGLIFVSGKNASFTMNGGTIRNAFLNAHCGGVKVCGDAEFIMNDGTISNFNAGGNYRAGAVLVIASDDSFYSGGTAKLTMNGGIIENNQGYRGAGVCVCGMDYYKQAIFIMKDGIIRNNTVNGTDSLQSGGGSVYVECNAAFTMNGGTITGNTANNGHGGGVCAACGWEEIAGTPGWTIDLYSSYYPAAFTMNNGTISYNKATENTSKTDNGCGGGIYLASNCVTLNKGIIEKNEAERQGGGVYVASLPYVLKLNTTVVKNNNASVLGGGIWACPTGEVESYITNGIALYDNEAAGAGDDFVSVKSNANYTVTLANRALGGGKILWYKDGGLDTSTILGTSNSDVSRYSSDNGELVGSVQNSSEPYALKAILSEQAKKLAEDEANLIIRDNTAQRGGGIGTNGKIVMGKKDYHYTLSVQKEWSGLESDTKKVPVTVFLKIGDQTLDSVELNESNNWTATFTELPDPNTLAGKPSYSVVESPVPAGFVPTYSETVIDDDLRTIHITVDNEYSPATGNLKVSKTVSGNAASTTKAFTFTVTLSDTSISGTYGDMVFENGIAVFTLKTNESKTALDLPAGTTYTVVESDNSGYTVTVNGSDQTTAAGTITADCTTTEAFNNHKASSNNGGGNTPISSPAKVTIKAQKTLDGSAAEGSDYSFILKDESGNVIQTVQNNGGNITFATLTFSKTGTYTYTLSEVIGTDSTINYDTSVYRITIDVTKSGDYKATVSYEKDGMEYNGTPVFANTTNRQRTMAMPLL